MPGLLLIISFLAQMSPFGCGQTARVVAKPNEGYRFVEWSDGVKEAERTVVLTSDSTITARFEKKSPTAVEKNTNNPSPKAKKVLIDGHLFILRDGKTYTTQGIQLK